MATAATVPIEVYLRTSYEPDAEYVDGIIQERPMGEYDHAAWQAAILEFFRSRRNELHIRALAELRVQVSASRFRVPDVVILDKNSPVEQIIKTAPIAVFEILSPEDSLTRTMEKCTDYEQMGIKTILIVNPKGPKYRFQQGKLEPLFSLQMDIKGRIYPLDFSEVEKLLD